jgi:hypothetical protein
MEWSEVALEAELLVVIIDLNISNIFVVYNYNFRMVYI